MEISWTILAHPSLSLHGSRSLLQSVNLLPEMGNQPWNFSPSQNSCSPGCGSPALVITGSDPRTDESVLLEGQLAHPRVGHELLPRTLQIGQWGLIL